VPRIVQVFLKEIEQRGCVYFHLLFSNGLTWRELSLSGILGTDRALFNRFGNIDQSCQPSNVALCLVRHEQYQFTYIIQRHETSSTDGELTRLL